MIKAGSKYNYSGGILKVLYDTPEIKGTIAECIWSSPKCLNFAPFDLNVDVSYLTSMHKVQEQDNKTVLKLKIKVDTSEIDAALEKVKEFNKEIAKVSPSNNFVRKVLGEPIIGKVHTPKVYTKNDLYIGMKIPNLYLPVIHDLHWTIIGFCGDFVYTAIADGTFSNHKMSIEDALKRLNQDCL